MYLCFLEYLSQSNLNRLSLASLALYPEYHGIKEILFCKISGKDIDSSHKAQVSVQASIYWKELAVLLRLLVGAYLLSQCLKTERTTFHCSLPQAGVKGNSGIREKHHCFCSNDLEKHTAAGKKCNLVQWKWSSPFLSAGTEQPLGSRGRRGSSTGCHAEDGIQGLLSPSCHPGLGVSTVPQHCHVQMEPLRGTMCA